MTVSISYQLSPIGRKESLRQRGDGKLVQTILVNPDDPIYGAALDLASVDTDGKATLTIGNAVGTDGRQIYAVSVSTPTYDAPQTAESLVREEAARRADTTARAAKLSADENDRQRLRHEERVAGLLAQGLTPLESTGEIGAIYWNGSRYATTHLLSQMSNEPRVADLSARAGAECARLNAEREADKAREQAEKKTLRETGEKTLREWSEARGSALLKARIADGFEWLGLAEHEYANAIVAELGDEIEIPEYKTTKEGERTTPALEEIIRLREVRKMLAGQPAAVSLEWSEYKIETTDEYGDTEQEFLKRPEIKVIVTCPTGRTLDYFYACPVAEEVA